MSAGMLFSSSAYQTLFDADGIISMPMLDSEEIAALVSFYNSTSKEISDRAFHSTMFIDDAGYRKKISEGIQQIIAPKLHAVIQNSRTLFANYIVKAPSTDSRVGIHQDWHFTLPEYTSINFWIPLVDITVQTGLFHALKGSHRTFRNIRYTPYESDTYKGLEEYILQNSSAFSVQAGEVLFYHGALVHFSDPNISENLRIAAGGVLIPNEAPNLHYYKRHAGKNELEVYEVNEDFYQRFNFFEEPLGVKMIGRLSDYETVPLLDQLNQNVK